MVSGFEKFMLSFRKTSPANLKQLENKALHNLVTCVIEAKSLTAIRKNGADYVYFKWRLKLVGPLFPSRKLEELDYKRLSQRNQILRWPKNSFAFISKML